MSHWQIERTAKPKPIKGAYVMERRQREAEHKRREEKVMARVKAEDHGKCRVPRCRYTHARIEVAHEVHRGMGGNAKEDRTARERLITLCSVHHQLWDKGDPALGALEIEPLDGVARFRGCCAYYLRNLETGRRECIGVEQRIGESETRGV